MMIWLCRINRKDHRVHYVSIDVLMNIALPSHQNKFENLQTPNENNHMSKGKRFFHRFHDVSWTFWSYSPYVKEIHIVERNASNASKSNKKLVECITKTKEFHEGQVSAIIIDKRNLQTFLCSDVMFINQSTDNFLPFTTVSVLL